MNKHTLELILLLLLFTINVILGQSQKGIWLTDIASDALDSEEGIKTVVQRCKAAGIGHIYVVVWNRGYTLYPSKVMEREFGKKVAPRFKEKDILKQLIQEAHSENLKVHAWFEFGFSSSYNEADGGHILRSKPEWKAIDNKGNLVSKNGFQWMNCFDPEVQDFLLSLITEVVTAYDIDGIQGDDRLPASPSSAGYDALTVAMYQQEHNGESPPMNYKDPAWVDWRAGKLNLFAQRIYETVKAITPTVMVTMAPSSFPWSKIEYLQDWPNWVKNGWVDKVIPQIYRYDRKAYERTLKENLQWVTAGQKKDFIPGVLLRVNDYTASRRFLKKMIQTNRKYGLDHEVFFFYEGLKKHEYFFNTIYPKMKR
ncbi:MAG: family 10 glycosylhydrolase [Bacteroidota bacterium]